VGLHTDQEVNRYRGTNHPIMNINERTLSVLANKYVDEVVIGAPYEVEQDMLDNFNVKIVGHGTAEAYSLTINGNDPYQLPKDKGIFKSIKSTSSLTTKDIITYNSKQS